MSILNGIFSLGYILGVQLGSRIESYILVFSLATVLGFLGVFYSIFILRESLKKKVSYIYMWIKRLQIETGLLQIEIRPATNRDHPATNRDRPAGNQD